MTQLAQQETTSQATAMIIRGLEAAPKQLSPALFYDKRGSELFDQICELPEYYVTRVETQILRTHAPADFGTYRNRLKLAGVKVTLDGSPQGRTPGASGYSARSTAPLAVSRAPSGKTIPCC